MEEAICEIVIEDFEVLACNEVYVETTNSDTSSSMHGLDDIHALRGS